MVLVLFRIPTLTLTTMAQSSRAFGGLDRSSRRGAKHLAGDPALLGRGRRNAMARHCASRSGSLVRRLVGVRRMECVLKCMFVGMLECGSAEWIMIF